MRIHFIAIGGSAMHNLAIALHKKGYHITGSDDEIFEPSRSRLAELGLLPAAMGWFPQKIEERPDAVILGMHARAGNPELDKARELGIRVYSYPEFLYEHARDKKRIVIGGSHGKTTITAIILHVLKHCNIDTDFMVGAQLKGFDVMVRLTDDAEMMVLEGDEYLTSAEDRRPKFHIYKPHIALLSGIAWDHINVFPTWEGYIEEFEKFVNLIEPDGSLVYCEEDDEVVKVANKAGRNLKKIPYGLPAHEIINGQTRLITGTGKVPLQVFGRHNLLNLEGARILCGRLGVKNDDFYSAISSFPGAANRLELMASNAHSAIYRDFAHSPSKLKATVEAVKEQFSNRQLVACMELHTFSSLSGKFLDHYKGALDSADFPMVYFNPHTIELKRLPSINPEQVKQAFNNSNLAVYTDSGEMRKDLDSIRWKDKNLLMMSSGNFNNIPMEEILRAILGELPATGNT